MANFTQNFLAGQALGRERRLQDEAIAKQNQLARLAGDAFAMPESRASILPEIARLDPGAAFEMQGAFDRQAQQEEATQQQRIVNISRLIGQAPAQARPSLYAKIRPTLQGMGVDLGEQWDDNLIPALQSFAGVSQDAGGLSPRMRSLQWARQNGHITEEQFRKGILVEQGLEPSAVAASYGYVEEYDPTTGATYRKPVLNRGLSHTGGPIIGSAPDAPVAQAPAPMPGLTVPSLISANFPTARITSGIRDPQTNASVGGVPNSLHMAGAAVDVVPESPQQAAMIRQFAQQQGLQVIEYPDGRLHLERDTGGARPNFSPVPVPGLPRPQAGQAEMDRRANATLDRQTYSTPRGPIQSGPTTEQRAAAEARVAAAQTEARIEAEGEATGNYQQEKGLREEFEKAVATPKAVVSTYRRIANAAAAQNGIGDLDMIFAYMKMLDPASVVRESEFEQVGRTGGLPAQVQGYFNRIQGAGSLSPDVRAQIVRHAATLRDGAEASINAERQRARELAVSYGFNPDRVAAPGAAPPSNANPAQPATGGIRIISVTPAGQR